MSACRRQPDTVEISDQARRAAAASFASQHRDCVQCLGYKALLLGYSIVALTLASLLIYSKVRGQG